MWRRSGGRRGRVDAAGTLPRQRVPHLSGLARRGTATCRLAGGGARGSAGRGANGRARAGLGTSCHLAHLRHSGWRRLGAPSSYAHGSLSSRHQGRVDFLRANPRRSHKAPRLPVTTPHTGRIERFAPPGGRSETHRVPRPPSGSQEAGGRLACSIQACTRWTWWGAVHGPSPSKDQPLSQRRAWRRRARRPWR